MKAKNYQGRHDRLNGRKGASGNNVSHAHNKTKRRFDINLQSTTQYSELLKRRIKLKISTRTLRTIDIKGGFDEYLKDSSNSQLSPQMRRLKRDIVSKEASNDTLKL